MQHIDVTAADGNYEAQRYAMDFVKALRAAGCTADLSLPIPGMLPDVEGIRIGVHMPLPFAKSIDQLPENVQKLHAILDVAHITHTVSPLTPDFFSGKEFVLCIGAKPKIMNQ
jgi:hypothetical protein